MTEEIWKQIKDFPNYEASSLGRVRNRSNGYLKQIRIRFERPHVTLRCLDPEKGYKQREILLSTLIGRTFLGEPPTNKHRVRFKDGNICNCAASNLYYGTTVDIVNDAWKKRPRKQVFIKPVRTKETIQPPTEPNVKVRIEFKCDYCGTLSSDFPSHYKRKKKHFCGINCRAQYAKTIPKEQHASYKARVRRESIKVSAPIPFEKRHCPVCPGKQPLGHCWEPEFRPKDYRGTHPTNLIPKGGE